MLKVREKGAFSVGVSGKTGKVVEFCGVSLAGTLWGKFGWKFPQHINFFINNCSCNVIKDVCVL